MSSAQLPLTQTDQCPLLNWCKRQPDALMSLICLALSSMGQLQTEAVGMAGLYPLFAAAAKKRFQPFVDE
jgi:hypothetical protein